MVLGERLREEREKRGLTQRLLAAEIGLHQSDVSRIEQGRRMLSLDEAIRLASVLAVPLQWFLTGTSRPGRELPDLAMELQRLGAVDLLVKEKRVSWAFRRPEEVVACALCPARVDPRVLEALPAVLAWNRWSVGLLDAFAREADRRVINRLGWLAEVVLVIERTEGFPGGVISGNELTELLQQIDQPREPDDLGHPADPSPTHRAWKYWRIGYAAEPTTFRDRARGLLRLGSGPRGREADA